MIETWYNQDLNSAVKVQYLNGNVFSMDNNGNKIGVNVFQDGEPVTLTGSISADVIRSDGGTVAVSGTASDNQAYVVLPQACYAVPGVISIVIKNTVSSDVTTLCAVVTNVYQSSTDSVVDPGTIIPSVQTLISQIETAVASIPADYSSLWTSLAPAFSSSTSYQAGQYVTYNGGVYRFTTAHSGSWAAGDVTAVNIGGELSDVKSEIREEIYKELSDITTVSGFYIRTNGTIGSDSGLNVYAIPCTHEKKYRIVATGNTLRIGTVTNLANIVNDAALSDANTSSGTNKTIIPSTGENYIVVYVSSYSFTCYEVLPYDVVTKEEMHDVTDDVYEEVNNTTTVSGFYIRSDGTIGTDEQLNVYAVPCSSEKKYHIIASESATTLRIGTVKKLSDIVNNASLHDANTNSEMNKVISPSEGYNFIVVYVYGGTFQCYRVLPYNAIDKEMLNVVETNIYNGKEFCPVNFSTDGQFLENVRIDNTGEIVSATSWRIAYIACKPNTFYKLEKIASDDYLDRIGYTSGESTDIATGLKLDGYATATNGTAFIITPANATYVIISGRATHFNQSKIVLSEETVWKVLDVPMERGGWNGSAGYDNDASHYSNRIRTAYFIKVFGSNNMKVNTSGFAHTYIIPVWYGNDYSRIGYGEASEDNPVFVIPSNTYYAKIEIYSQANPEHITIETNGTTSPSLMKNVLLDSTNPSKILFALSDGNFTTSRLLLPPNYTPTGNPVPLILWMDGTGNFNSWDRAMSEVKVPYLKYLRDEGFAVFSVFAMGHNYFVKYSTCGRNYPFAIPTNIDAITRGVEYICDRFNVDANNIHIMSKSQGGQCATYFASRPTFKVRSIGMFAPVVDYLSQQTAPNAPASSTYIDVRHVIADDLNLGGEYLELYLSENYHVNSEEGRAFWNDNKTALCQLNEAWTNLTEGTLDEHLQDSLDDGAAFWTDEYWSHPEWTDIYTHNNYHKIAQVPVKIWGASDDDKTPYLAMVQLINQLQNGGCEAVMRSFERGTGGHDCADIYNKIASVTTALNIVYTDLPAGWYENVQWIRQHMPK